jgi:hypothetical protein
MFTLVYTELLEISIQNQAMGSTETTRPLVQNREGKAGFGWWMLGGNQQKKEWGNSEKQHYRNMGKKYRFYRSHNS